MTEFAAKKPYVPPAERTYRYLLEAGVMRRIDADTLVLLVEMPVRIEVAPLGIFQTGRLPHEVILRLDGVDAPEDETPEGKVAVAFVDDWLAGRQAFQLASDFRRDRYHRVLGQLVTQGPPGEGEVLAQALLDLGHARRWT